MVVFDATMLLLLVAPDVAVPRDTSGDPISYSRERMYGLIAELSERKTKIIIPTPALSEVFVRTDQNTAIAYVQKLKKSRHFRVEPFCERAALEVALISRDARASGDKKDGRDATWAKIKYDRQIVGIAAAHNAGTLYTDDAGLKATASRRGLRAIGLADLPIPEEKAQIDWISDAER